MNSLLTSFAAGSLCIVTCIQGVSAQSVEEKDREWRNQQPPTQPTSDDAAAASEKISQSLPPAAPPPAPDEDAAAQEKLRQTSQPVVISPTSPDEHDHEHAEAANGGLAFTSTGQIMRWLQAGAPMEPGPDGVLRMASVHTCPTEPGPGATIFTRGANDDGGIAGGGMTGNGWDGSSQGAVTLSWHMGNVTGDFTWGSQRAALIAAMQAFANVVQITFVEHPSGGLNTEVDWSFQTGNHCGSEGAECGDADCVFTSSSPLAHAAFPPGVNSACGGVLSETFSGNVHFNDAFTWEDQAEGAAGSYSMRLTAAHELGHALGLVHSADTNDVMFASASSTQTFTGLSAGDIANIRLGYATGNGSVITLESSGVWVNLNASGQLLGTQFAPFKTVPQGVGGVPWGNNGVILHVQAGVYPQTVFADKRMTIKAENGTVRIGG